MNRQPALPVRFPRWWRVASLVALPAAVLSLAAPPAPDPARIDQALTDLPRFDWGQSTQALVQLDEAVAASYQNPAAQQDLARRLGAMLEGAATPAAKQYVCRKLALIGTADSVPALAALLPDPVLAHSARIALERIPDAAAGRVLCQALPIAAGTQKLGIIDSLGARRQPEADALLAPLLSHADPAVARAAALALARIATPAAARALTAFQATAPGPLQPVALAACLEVAERLLKQGDQKRAAKLFADLWSGGHPEHVRLAAFRGLVATEPKQATKRLTNALAGNDARVRQLAARLVEGLPRNDSARPFLAAFDKLPSAGQEALLAAFGFRQEQAARPLALQCVRRQEAGVRLAALRALALLGNASDLPLLAGVAASGVAEESAAARASLAALRGQGVESAMLSLAATAQGPTRAELIRALSAREAKGRVPAVLKYLADTEPAVRRATLQMLSSLGGDAQVPPLVAHLKAQSTAAERERARSALEAIARRSPAASAEHLIVGLQGAHKDSRLELLRLLNVVAGAKALDQVRAAVTDADADVRDTATRVLADWPESAAAPDLLRLAAAPDSPTFRALGFRGYVRLARGEQLPGEERLRMLAEIARLAQGPEDKRLVIAALGDLNLPAALKPLGSYLDDAAVRREAALAALSVCSRLEPKHKADATPVLDRILGFTDDADAVGRARQVRQRFEAPATSDSR